MNIELKTCLAGAILANAPLLILNYLLLSSISLSDILSSLLVYGVCLTTSTIAGYLVARRLSGNHLKAGAITGFLSYIIYAIIVTSFLPTDTWDLAPVLGFLMGGCIGSKILENWSESNREAIEAIKGE